MRFPTLVALTCSAALIFTPVAFAGEAAAPETGAATEAPPAVEMPAGIPDATISVEPEAPAAPAAAAAPAGAADFAGTWGNDAAQCAVPQDQQNAPMVLTEKGFDQHETHCLFSDVKAGDSGWKIQATCSVEGDEQPAEFNLSVKGDTLTMGDEAGNHDMIRCKS